MAIGRTNAAAGKMKSVVGTFTSSKAGQSTFSVAGLTFTPKIVVVRLLSSSNSDDSGNGFYMAKLDAVQIIDIDTNIAVYMYKSTSNGTFSTKWMDMASPATTFANGTLTVYATQNYGHTLDSHWTIGNYEYRIYG
jgi:hypothetical protein